MKHITRIAKPIDSTCHEPYAYAKCVITINYKQRLKSPFVTPNEETFRSLRNLNKEEPILEDSLFEHMTSYIYPGAHL